MQDINTTPIKTKIERACWQFINIRPFHKPRLQLCIPQAAVNAVFKIDEEITKTRSPSRFFDVFTAIKCIVSLFGLFRRPQWWQISRHFQILQRVKSLPFHITEVSKNHLFRVRKEPSLSRGHYSKYPPGNFKLQCSSRERYWKKFIVYWNYLIYRLKCFAFALHEVT